MKSVFAFFTLILCVFSHSYSQTGIVRGVVTDKQTGENLAFVDVYKVNSTDGTTTDLDGAYALELPYGTYSLQFSYLGYADFIVNDVEISKKVQLINVALSVEGELMEELVVSAKQARNTTAALATIKKKSPNLLDGVSSQTFKSIGDGDAGEAIKRVTGVSVEGGKHVYVRGLGDRYTKTMLNGMNMPGLDPDRNTVQLDVFPTNVIDNILVYKTFSPDIPGDFSGGLVDIILQDFPEAFTFNISGSLGYNPQANLNNQFLSYSGGKTDWLGYDDGTRALKLLPTTIIPDESLNNPALTSYTETFSKTMAAREIKSGLNKSFGLSLGNQYNVSLNKTIGWIGAINWNQGYKFYDNAEYKSYVAEPVNELEMYLDRSSKGAVSEKEALLSGLLGLSFKTKVHSFSLSTLHIQKGEDRVAKLIANGGEDNPSIIYKDILEYAQRFVTNVNLEGISTFSKSKYKIEWKLSPTWVEVDEPDIRSTGFELRDGEFLLQPSVGADISRSFRNLKEKSYNGKIDFSMDFKQWSGLDSKLKLGFNILKKERDFGIQAYTFRTNGQSSLQLNGDPDRLFIDENIWTPENQNGLYVVGNYVPANTFNAKQDILAGYLMSELAFSKKLKTTLGARVEKTDNYYTGINNQQTKIYNNQKVLDDLDVLPSVNMVYSLSDNANLRLSYNSTVVRPSFKEKSIAQIQDFVSERTFIGNIDLESSQIQNYDLRWENYFDGGNLISISGFYKNFKNPIELVSYSNESPDNYTPRNFEGKAQVYGVEFEISKNMDFISHTLRNLRVSANASVIKSELTRDNEVYVYTESTRPMAGQSPYLINASLSYSGEDNGFDATVGYNVQGKRLSIVGIGVNPDVYELPFDALDAKISKSFGSKKYKVSLSANNLLNSKKRFAYDGGAINTGDYYWANYNPGSSFSLGFSASL
ncbi:MAG TPA: TonB-dependent receptor [Saprospiraceae bacterium]|nr:TonB-dependent receptor [Saprospiraceae bacterium]